ncbi:HEXXH motif-containing putative peptide modification protein [Streptomyces sp. LX-29]|uniref:HEXXH motif domain-containing protein n=1 Tax=Streptomyces sp. LX-29 TaxID=2900152 RepID=UPI00240D5419|nr:HEXXH motif domain-containing protein [Streptomyces sp. LX-29]WFB06725.1 HEXXH motif-containing putative peptide modification protein [Streptomyces sp. LX-29]
MPEPSPGAHDRGRRHELSRAQYDAVAGGAGDAGAYRRLWEAERSHRLLLFDLLMDMEAERPGISGPLPAAAGAWELLLAAERRDRVSVEELLLLPETGLWLGRLLRRLRGPSATDVPVWVEVGHLHALAAAAAVLAGLEFTQTVPTRAGTVWLPSLGRASLPPLPGGEPWGVAEVRSHGGALTIRDGAGREVHVPGPLDQTTDTWQPARRVDLGSPAPTRPVFLDDLGPHHIGPVPPERLSDRAADRWEARLREAWPLLVEADPQSAADVAAFLRTVEPLPAENLHHPSSATSADGVGRLAASEPLDAVQLAATLAHEIHHSKLNVLTHMYSLVDSDAEAHLYAPWRNEPRPLRGMLQGVYAFTAVARFWRGRGLRAATGGVEDAGNRDLAGFEYALWRCQLSRVLPGLREEPGLTPLGRRLVDRLTETVAAWVEEPLPAHILTTAHAVADDHAMAWRLHHLAPDAVLVACAADAWLKRAGDPGPLPFDRRPLLRADPDVPQLDVRAALFRVRLADPRALENAEPLCQAPETVVPGARAADIRLTADDAAGALKLYLREIVDAGCAPEVWDPDARRATAGAWAGLGVALGAVGERRAAHALRQRPELVRGVHRAVWDRTGEPPDPISLAAWLDVVSLDTVPR